MWRPMCEGQGQGYLAFWIYVDPYKYIFSVTIIAKILKIQWYRCQAGVTAIVSLKIHAAYAKQSFKLI